jgi:hypothetical protein
MSVMQCDAYAETAMAGTGKDRKRRRDWSHDTDRRHPLTDVTAMLTLDAHD